MFKSYKLGGNGNVKYYIMLYCIFVYFLCFLVQHFVLYIEMCVQRNTDFVYSILIMCERLFPIMDHNYHQTCWMCHSQPMICIWTEAALDNSVCIVWIVCFCHTLLCLHWSWPSNDPFKTTIHPLHELFQTWPLSTSRSKLPWPVLSRWTGTVRSVFEGKQQPPASTWM